MLFLLRLVVQDCQVGRRLPYFLGVEILRKGGLRCLQQDLLARSWLVQGSIIWSRQVLDDIHEMCFERDPHFLDRSKTIP